MSDPKTPRFPKLALFDLDGTLLDSAPDMAATVNRMRAARGRGPMPLEDLRPHVSRGARAMSAAAFPELGGEVPPETIREFLDAYEQELGRSGTLFEGVAELLRAIEDDGARWGIVTNKPEYLARQLLPLLGWQDRCAILAACAALLKPGGRLVVSTLNRTPAAFALAIVGAEYVARVLPKGTHQYRDFIKPSELAKWLREAGLELEDVSGLMYEPWRNSARLIARTDVNYLACAFKPLLA